MPPDAVTPARQRVPLWILAASARGGRRKLPAPRPPPLRRRNCFHYNRPYGDIYMAVGEAFRTRGIGTYLVQELKRVCYEGGSVPAARCSPKNVASRQTLQRAGFIPCGHILTGTVDANWRADSASAPNPPDSRM